MSYTDFSDFSAMKKQPSQLRGQKRVDHILDTCELLLTEKPYEDISLDDIIERANASKGVVYHYFPDKQSIFVCLMQRTMIEVFKAVEPRLTDKNVSFVKYVLLVEKRLAKVWYNHRSNLDFYLNYRSQFGFLQKEWEIGRSTADMMYQEILRRKPEFPPQQAEHIALIIYENIVRALDLENYMNTRNYKALQKEWRNMLRTYIDSLGID